MEWKIGNVTIKNQVVLAPMAGYTNKAFRQIAKEMGAGLTVTEMISSEALVRENKKTLSMIDIADEKSVVAVQIFGSDPKTMASAAKILCETYKDIKIIDINMGCPVPKVAIASHSGSALLKDPEKVFAIVKEVTSAVPVPVTVKIRLGWDDTSINCIEIAKICEQAGAKALTVHARTRKQGYAGHADWSWIKKVKQSVHIPVIGNGDITSCFDAQKMIQETGCDAVMIGRGVLGNPWLIKECVDYLDNKILPTPVSYDEKIAMIKKHFTYLKETKTEHVALFEIRSNILFYLKGMPNNKEIKRQICEAKTTEEIFSLLDQYRTTLDETEKL